MSESDVDAVINDYRQALKSFVSGNSQPVAGLFSRRDDVTLANPLGPPHRGGQAVEDAFPVSYTHLTLPTKRIV